MHRNVHGRKTNVRYMQLDEKKENREEKTGENIQTLCDVACSLILGFQAAGLLWEKPVGLSQQLCRWWGCRCGCGGAGVVVMTMSKMPCPRRQSLRIFHTARNLSLRRNQKWI